MAKTAFIIPPIIKRFGVSPRGDIYLGAACVAAQLIRDGHDVSVIDCAVDCRSVSELKERLLRAPPDIAAIPVIYGTIRNAYAIAAAVKKTVNARVVFGGLPAAFVPERIFAECPGADICVLNEGELSMRELAAGRPAGGIAGLAYRQGGAVVRNRPGPYIKDLDAQPFAARHLFPLKKYRCFSLHTSSLKITTNLETKRGCPFSCEFCVQAPKEGARYRLRSVESVAEEMLDIKRRYPFIRRIMMVDNDFLSPFSHGLGVIEAILKNGLQKHFEFMIAARLGSFLRDAGGLISLCDRANIRMVYFGVESLNGKNLGRLKKIRPGDDIPGLFRKMREQGVHTVGSYIFGFENETRRDMLETVNASLRDRPSLVRYNILTPYPGTKVWEEYAAKGIIRKNVPLWHYDNAHQTIEHPVDCEKLMRQAYKRYYNGSGRFGSPLPRNKARGETKAAEKDAPMPAERRASGSGRLHGTGKRPAESYGA